MRHTVLTALAALAGAIGALAMADPVPERIPLHTRVRKAFSTALVDAKAKMGALKASGQDTQEVEGYRYFWFRSQGKDLPQARVAFQLHLNFLSRYSIPVRLDFIADDLCRIDVDMLQWDRGTLEAAQWVDPFFHQQDVLEAPAVFQFYWPGGKDSRGGETKGKPFKRAIFETAFKVGEVVPLHARWLAAEEVKEFRDLLYSEVPVLCAEWFLAQSCKQISARNRDDEGLGYYDFLQLANRDDFFKLIVFDKKGAERLGRKVKAAQEFSKVSALGRQIDGDDAQSGGVWVTLDPIDATGEGVVIRQLKEGSLNHQIEEWYGSLANGLPVTFLSNNLGVRANNAPADAVGLGDCSPLNEGNDRRIHIHLACIRCHAGPVLQPIKDWVRETYSGNPLALGDPDKKEALKLQKQYFADLEDKIETDRLRYQKAFRRVTVTAEYPKGLEAQKAVEAYCRTYHAYADDPVTLEVAAGDLGVDVETFRKQLHWLTTEVKLLDLRLAPLVRLGQKKPLPISRLTFEDCYELAMDVAHGIVPKLRKPRPRRPITPPATGKTP